MLLAGIIISFAFILTLVKFKKPIGIAITLGGILLALFAQIPFSKIIYLVLHTLIEVPTLELVVTVILINILSAAMDEYGVLEKMVDYLEKLFRSTKVLLFIFPSLLSTFTTTGSAIIAAPVIDSLGNKVGLTKPRKAAINLYIRHAWYFVLPISIPLINASYISNIPLVELMKVQLPVALACLLAAYFVYIKPLKDREYIQNGETKNKIIFNTLLYSSPLLVCILLVFWIPFYAALVPGIFLTYTIGVKKQAFKKVLLKSKNTNLILAVLGIMIFKNIIGNIPQIKTMIMQVIRFGIPLELLTIAVTLIIAYAVANPSLLVGMVYPLILPLASPAEQIPYAMLIFTVGFAAYFISPVHLCQALTNEYFGVSTEELFKEYKITFPVMFFSGLITFYVLRLIM
ncbi:MAG: DUF401 family protein [Bacillota bacterium]